MVSAMASRDRSAEKSWISRRTPLHFYQRRDRIQYMDNPARLARMRHMDFNLTDSVRLSDGLEECCVVYTEGSRFESGLGGKGQMLDRK